MKSYKVSEYINKALFDDKIGYYKTKNPIGKNSDFITSPEISQVFGEILAAYLLQFVTDKNTKYSLVEMGAGRAMLFYDILLTFEKIANKNKDIADLLKNVDFNIIEINPVLQEVQKKKLSNFKVNFYNNFDEFSKNSKLKKILFLSNELFDCFAIDQYIYTEIGWRERIIIEDENEKRHFSMASFDQKKSDFIKNEVGDNLIAFGSIFEYSSSAREFMRSLCKVIDSKGCLAINIDYGYFERKYINSLQGVKNHKSCDILKNMGNIDITSHVDFSSLDKISHEFSLNSLFVSQREFLISLGIEQRRSKLVKNNPKIAKDLNLAIDRLINYDQMGELFKFHIIWKK